MEITPQLLTGTVMHKRHFPKENLFTYRIYYLALPLAQLTDAALNALLPINRWGALSFYSTDHGNRQDTDLQPWARALLKTHPVDAEVDAITLVTLPRVLGYVFNPVSFWLCMDTKQQLRAVICEVNNTFGETHSYLCAHPDSRILDANTWLEAEKLFHVSPFLKREGRYRFRFALTPGALGIWIDYYAENGKKQLSTALTGTLKPLTRSALRRVFWSHPLITLKSILLIHWQAITLLSKGIRYISKPAQHKEKTSTTP